MYAAYTGDEHGLTAKFVQLKNYLNWFAEY